MSSNNLSPIDRQLLAINHRLKTAQLGIQLERRGQKINLRGTLPPRPGSHRVRSHQQRISLGCAATSAGIKEAEKQAKIIAGQLLQNTFDWNAYLPITGGGKLHQMDLSEKIQAFHVHFMANTYHKSLPSSQATWETAYIPYLRKLEAIAQKSPNLSLAEAIYKTLESIPINSRSRQICCTALGKFVEFLNLELPRELSEFWGTYNPSQTRMRQLPTDEQIVEVYHGIPNPSWRFVYGVMATYGLRNHEVFFCNYARLEQSGASKLAHNGHSIEILESTKTGNREVWPFYPEWVKEFRLNEPILPKINIDLNATTLQRIGQKVSAQLRRYHLPFNPYDLRHAWAVRTIHFGLPDTVAAQMMGHSVAIHTKTYHRWITRRDQQQAVETALQRSQLVAPSQASSP